MFRRYPYIGWLLLSILLWGIVGFRYMKKTHEMEPAQMAQTVTAGLQQKEKNFESLLKNKPLITKIFSEDLTESDVKFLTSLPYYLYAYDSGAIVFWNTNEMLVDCNYPKAKSDLGLLNNDRGSFIKKCVNVPYLKGRKRLTVIFPIVIEYPFENSYIKSHFENASYIPVSSELTTWPQKGSFAIKSITGKILCYITFSINDIPVWVPGHTLLWLLGAALLVTMVWLQLVTVYFTRKRSSLAGLLVTVVIIAGARALTYIFGLPFNLGALPVFSPQLYASSSFLPSLGDLLLNALCFLWIVVFVVRHVPYNVFKDRIPGNVSRWIIAAVCSVILVFYCFGFINIISTLVLDSRISFDVTHFYSITSFTLLGLFTIGIITGASCLVIYLLNVQLATLVANKWLKYLLVAAIGTIIVFITRKGNAQYLYFLFLGWVVLFIFLLDIKKLTYIADVFSPQTIFWAFFVCAFCTATLQYFNYVKERETRKRFAEQIIKQRDYVTEYAFKNISQNIQRDPVLKNFLVHPTQDQRRLINERFDALYLGGQLNKYMSKVFLFDSLHHGLYNNDTANFQTLEKRLSESDFTMDPTLYYKEDALDGRYYMASIPIYSTDSTNKQLGQVFIDFAIKESFGESVYPELLQPGNVKSDQNETGYSYGVYVNNKLITQASEYGFPPFWNTDSLVRQHTFFNWESSSELIYKAGKSKAVIVIRYYKLWLESITLFSYLFGIQMLIVVLIVVYRLGLTYFTKYKNAGKLINFTLRNRIHFSMLGVVLISFFLLGLVTIAFFILQYKQSNTKKLQLAMQGVERLVVQYLKQQTPDLDKETFNEQANTTRFKYFISNLANNQKVDINIYNGSGILAVTSQENIYDKFLLARIIRPDAYYKLMHRENALIIQDERIGRLSYLSCYFPLRTDDGQTIGYINVPFFSSEKELNYQISNILVALINLYAFIFLISGVLTVFITRWITKTLSVVINRFERLSLTKNELIDWPYDDEIGLLVKEYNKMVRKVEENAVLLAQNERESAWREMARQVAHEIKNPLTPMKLNIQYLQQALKTGYANIGELTAKVTESLIEQIDNLSYIASEFSNFAKMPEARPEEVDLNELIARIGELYLNENIKVQIDYPQEPLLVFADRSQLLRMFTNIMENAVQSIPDERSGKITITLKQENDAAVVSFKDNGRGIPPDVVEKIFQPYFTTKSSGTGLGLAMTKKIIEFWKGAIWFETEEGKGTTFFIRIPLLKKQG